MKVNDLMSRVVVSVQDTDSLLKVIELLDEHRISGMPVFDKEKQLVGVISRYDLSHPQVLKHLNSGKKLDSLSVSQVKDFKKVISVQETDSVEQAALVMSENQVHRVIVTNPIGHVVGILTTYDITKLKATDKLKNYEHPDLTNYDKQFIRLIILHKSEKEMATIFHMSESDVYEWIKHIQDKLDVNSPAEVIARAFELHLFVDTTELTTPPVVANSANS